MHIGYVKPFDDLLPLASPLTRIYYLKNEKPSAEYYRLEFKKRAGGYAKGFTRNLY